MKNSKTPVIVGVIAIAAIAGAGVYAFNSGSKPANTTPAVGTTSTGTSQQTATTASGSGTDGAASTPASYKDGTYTASASYSVPQGYTNTIKVSLTMANGTISDITTSNSTSDHESQDYLDAFDSAIKSVVVGKNLGSVSPSRVGGASLTTAAFNNALADIASQAKG